jgi:hypothetical protein
MTTPNPIGAVKTQMSRSETDDMESDVEITSMVEIGVDDGIRVHRDQNPTSNLFLLRNTMDQPMCEPITGS